MMMNSEARKRAMGQPPTPIDRVIRDHAMKAERIYNDRTAGDHTWTGFLADFLMELEASGVTVR